MVIPGESWLGYYKGWKGKEDKTVVDFKPHDAVMHLPSPFKVHPSKTTLQGRNTGVAVVGFSYKTSSLVLNLLKLFYFSFSLWIPS